MLKVAIFTKVSLSAIFWCRVCRSTLQSGVRLRSRKASFNLSGTATVTNSPCISPLTLSGQAIGEAFRLTDAASKAVIIALPTGNNFTFSYNFDPTATSCAGDFGRGEVTTNQSPWDY
jgi:hypothetical protein